MSKQTDQSELSRTIAQQTRLDQTIVEAFISQLFSEIEKGLVVDSHIKVDGLGLFKVIKSGDSDRILYLGNTAPVNKAIDLSHLDNEPIVQEAAENLSTLSEVEFLPIEDTGVITHPNREEGTITRKEINSEQDFSEADAIVIRNFHNYEREKSKTHSSTVQQKSSKSNLIKTFIVALIVLAVLGIGYILLSGAALKPKEKLSNNVNITFRELDNTDSLNYSRIIIPESDVSLQYIAKIYYGYEVYWPYIYEANKNIVNSSLVIQAGSITKVPKITVDLAGLNNGNEASIAKALGDQISKEIR